MAVSMAVTMTVTPTNSTIISAPTMDTKAATNAVKHPHPLQEQPSNNIAQSPSHHIYIQYSPFTQSEQISCPGYQHRSPSSSATSEAKRPRTRCPQQSQMTLFASAIEAAWMCLQRPPRCS